jgi:dTDP-4-amino-4,6-dideoxygalactose transaminase
MDELSAIAREHGVPLIQDAAHALGASYHGRRIGELSDFSCFSFQAVKHITTGDGGMILLGDEGLAPKARRLRWFGIDRTAKQRGVWENDIKEIGYKYQMTDLAAALGLAALDEFESTLAKRRELLAEYERGLAGIPGVEAIGAGFADRTHAAWLCTVLAENRLGLMRKLRDNHIESAQVHYRNDAYTVFRGTRSDLPNMDALEDKYLVLPLHPKLAASDVRRVCAVIKSGW